MRKLIFPMLVMALCGQACSGGGKKDVDTNLKVDEATESIRKPDTLLPDHTKVPPDTATRKLVPEEKSQ